MRLKAFTAPTIQNIVNAQSRAGGIDGQSVWKPRSAQNHAKKAIASWPRSLSFGGRFHLSSARPRRKTAVESATKRRE